MSPLLRARSSNAKPSRGPSFLAISEITMQNEWAAPAVCPSAVKDLGRGQRLANAAQGEQETGCGWTYVDDFTRDPDWA